MNRKQDTDILFDILLSEEYFEVLLGFIVLIIGWLIALVNKNISLLIGLGLAGYYFYSGLSLLVLGESKSSAYKKPAQIRSAKSAPTPVTPTLAEKMSGIPRDLKCPSCGANIKATDKLCRYCGSTLVPLIELPEPAHFGDVQIGQSVRVTAPEKGQLTLSVRSRLYYGELWQAQMRPNVPWTLTGNYYVGLMLEPELFLLNWQDRFFLLDSHAPLTDMQISRDFAPYAREFAASNQTADVRFRYGDTKWRLDDLGKFRIEFEEGDKTQFTLGAIGRFIHASSGNIVLVIEDYESGGGGGQDTLWKGWLINEKDIYL